MYPLSSKCVGLPGHTSGSFCPSCSCFLFALFEIALILLYCEYLQNFFSTFWNKVGFKPVRHRSLSWHCGHLRPHQAGVLSAFALSITLPYPLHLKGERQVLIKKNFRCYPESHLKSTISSLSSITISEVVKEPRRAEVPRGVLEDDGEQLCFPLLSASCESGAGKYVFGILSSFIPAAPVRGMYYGDPVHRGES